MVSTYIGMATASNAYSLQLGDCLNSNDVGHVVLVTDLIYSGNTLTSIEITEQTPPQLKRSYYTPAQLGAKYGTYYGISGFTGTVEQNTTLLSLLKAGKLIIPGSGNTATQDKSYVEKCTFYPSSVKIEVTTATYLYSEPRTAKSTNTSVELEAAPLGTTYTTTGIYQNTGGNMWYQVKTSSGETGYIYAGRVKYLKKDYSDIKLTKYDVPTTISEGDIFLVTGTIKDFCFGRLSFRKIVTLLSPGIRILSMVKYVVKPWRVETPGQI